MKYETGRPLGRGAMGEVYKAFDPTFQHFVALKYLRWEEPAGAAEASEQLHFARLAVASFERALDMDKLLEREFGQPFSEAQGRAARATTARASR